MKTIRGIITTFLSAALLTISAAPAQAAEVSVFTDVSPSAWYADAVAWGTEQGIITGTSPTTFSPNAPVTRGMFVTLLGRLAGAEVGEPSNMPFTDVAPTAYYAPYVVWASKNHLANGTSKTAFSPENPITREQAACFFYRYGQWLGMDPAVTGTYSGYRDRDQVSCYAREAVAWAVGHDLLQGNSRILDPRGTATRAQIAVILQRAGRVLASPQKDADSPKLARLKALVANCLPSSCRWDPRALDAGWYGPMTLRMNGSLSNIAEGCRYTIAEIHGMPYDVYYITEPVPGEFYCYYG